MSASAGKSVKQSGKGTSGASMALLVLLGLGAIGAGVWGVRVATRGQAPDGLSSGGSGGKAGGTAATSPAKARSVDEALHASLELQRDRQWPKARALLEESILEHPQEQALYVQLAQTLVGLELYGEAYQRYEQALAIGPRDGELEFAAGTCANAADRLDRAVEHYEAAEAALKTDHRPALFLAQVLIKLNRLDEAKVRLRRVQMMKPEEAIAHGTMAEVFVRENLPDLAIQTVAEARRLQPEYLPWRLVEARALKRKGAAREALDLLMPLSAAQKIEPGVLALMGECLGMLRKPEEAAALFALVANEFPQRGDVALETALWFERAGDAGKAREFAGRAKMLAVEGAAEVVARLEER